MSMYPTSNPKEGLILANDVEIRSLFSSKRTFKSISARIEKS